MSTSLPSSSAVSSPSPSRPRHAIIIGGSLGGLFAGTMLRQIGWDVDIYERSASDLDSRGGGIVLQPEVLEVFRRIGVDIRRQALGVPSINRVVLDKDGSVRVRRPAPQTQTSWSLIYSTLKSVFGSEHYHQGRVLSHVEQEPDSARVTACFEDGSRASGDLLIGADGGDSRVRRQFWPAQLPGYAGYLAWRGLLPEADMPATTRAVLHGDFGFANHTGSHILGYLVPGEGNSIWPEQRLYNWVWYRVASEAMLEEVMLDRDGRQRAYSLPEGLLAPRWRQHLREEAPQLLPPPFRDAVLATDAPFVQAIRDLAVEQMVSGRVLILGDAASIPRPHTAASTLKAAANALSLADALQASPDDIDAALARWEPRQVALGQQLLRQGVEAGQLLLFHHP
ncbi:MAG TPA: FAD binding domain-containing protein [Herbaspirillum sp.]|uniref:FAD binding domain-containing protein n=1 Tax=Herbaspirillum sp. TaxID=1890675 RepID=UPI002D35C2AE|nr:FAD binding domain-containing protein [Herbaspirillum sp.]HZG20717.1 FAD binding domain-containing protein [Herbaspirillum sp.]